MIIGIGTDILSIKRIKDLLKDEASPFIKQVFTKRELEQAGALTDRSHYLATRFAGKEAVFKSLGINWDTGVTLKEIEILDAENGAPFVRLYGRFFEQAQLKNIEKIHISLSYENDYAIGYSVAEARSK